MSRSDLSVQKVERLRPIDGPAFRAWFAPAFATFLQANYRNPEEVSAVFHVRSSTAWSWWNGDNRASGDVVARAFLMMPEATAWFLREWEGQ